MTLPKLRTSFLQVEKYLSNDSIKPQQLEHELKRFIPRIKKLSNEIDDLEKQVPKSIQKSLDNMKKQIDFFSKDENITNEKDLIQSEIYKMKGKMDLKALGSFDCIWKNQS